MATIVAAHDLSGIGRCSLTTALAVLPAMGHHCRPLPTAVLSLQTGLPGYHYLDLTAEMPAYLDSWRTLAGAPDMIYTGFLGSGRQTTLLSAWIREHPRARVVVDPVLGDDGILYGCYEQSFIAQMRELAGAAHIIVPNATELLLLAGMPGDAPFPQDDGGALRLVRELRLLRLEQAVVTSVRRGGALCNLLVEPISGAVETFPCRHNGLSFSGAGDLFASVFCGSLASGADVRGAVQIAANLVSAAADATPPDADPRFGLHYEPLLAGILKRLEERGTCHEK